MLLFVLQMFVAGGFVVFALSDGMATLPKEHSAFLAGICISAWALVTGLLMPVIGHLFDHARYGSYVLARGVPSACWERCFGGLSTKASCGPLVKTDV